MNTFRFKRLLSRSGPIPHNDPPTFKSHKFKRIIQFGDHHRWIGNSSTMEYFINMKHMYLQNLEASILQSIKIYFGIVMIPTCIITFLKTTSHDTRNYYNKKLTFCSGPLAPPNNDKEFYQKLKEYQNATYKDPLGRKGLEYYNPFAPFTRDLSIKCFKEIEIEKSDDYIGNK